MIADATEAKAPIAPANTNREIELLLCCARTHIDSARAERIELLLQQHINWDYLIQTALAHKVMPLVYWNLNSSYAQAVPQERLVQLRDYFYTNARRSFVLTGELLQVLNLFSAQGIPAIAFKGPILGELIYGQTALRQFCDLDILIDERNLAKTKQLLISQGYTLQLQYNWQYHFIHKDSRTNLDIHYAGITPKERPLALNFQQLWSRLQPVCIAGTEVLSLQPEDLLLILCVQVAKDCWQWKEQLGKICDIAEVIRVHQQMDWHWVMKQAHFMGCERMVLLSLLLAQELLGTTLPQEVWQKIPAHPVVKKLSQQVILRLFRKRSSPVAQLPKFRDTEKNLFYFAVRERQRDRLPYFFHLLNAAFAPSLEDQESLPLPTSVHFLYYFIRPFRIVKKYSLSLLKQ